MKVTETGDAHQIMVKIQDCINKHLHENDLDIQKARGKVALLKTSKKKSLIYSTIFPKESFDSTNIVSQSQYEERFYDMLKNLRNLTKYLRNMYCSSSKSSQSLDTRSLFPEEKHVIRMVLILFGKPVDEEQLLDDIVKELGQTGLVLEIENVRKTAVIPIRFTSEQIKFISKAAARVYNTVSFHCAYRVNLASHCVYKVRYLIQFEACISQKQCLLMIRFQ
ncbi:unnamed protein product [Mytilus coruscus]|uniref:Uncharacterized protein n=1 Tax=Mytilus coruscus TaxID=42192 RepID=A0A6J8AT98_MYTCO|nr:unnamed protein product [Mytilus coruscus]